MRMFQQLKRPPALPPNSNSEGALGAATQPPTHRPTRSVGSLGGFFGGNLQLGGIQLGDLALHAECGDGADVADRLGRGLVGLCKRLVLLRASGQPAVWGMG